MNLNKADIMKLDPNTPVAMLTVGQLKEALQDNAPAKESAAPDAAPKRYVYGIAGIARLFDCSASTANRIKASGQIDGAIRQIGRKIVVDADLALQLAGRKRGGRK